MLTHGLNDGVWQQGSQVPAHEVTEHRGREERLGVQADDSVTTVHLGG